MNLNSYPLIMLITHGIMVMLELCIHSITSIQLQDEQYMRLLIRHKAELDILQMKPAQMRSVSSEFIALIRMNIGPVNKSTTNQPKSRFIPGMARVKHLLTTQL